MFSALSSSSDVRMRSSSARSTWYKGRFAAFLRAAFFETGFLVEGFLTGRLAADLAFAGAFLAPMFLRVSFHPPSCPGTVQVIYHVGMTPTKPSAKRKEARMAVALWALRLPSMMAIAGARRTHSPRSVRT